MVSFFRSRFGFFALALGTGLLVGVSTVLLIECVGRLQDIVFARYGSDKISWLANKSDWSIFIAPILGGVIVGVILRNMPSYRFHGIADVIEASAMRSGRMDVRSGGIAALAVWVSLGSGAPLGREGPAVHIGASLTAWLAELLGLDRTQSMTLLGCAAAAAVTASFNTPIAGVLFALEVILGYYALRVFAPVVVAAMGAIIVRQSVYGSGAEFSLPDYVIGSFWELLVFALLGLLAALMVQLFIYSVMGVQWFWEKSHVPMWARPALAGVLIGGLALIVPLSLGVGYEGTSMALNEELPIALMMGLLIAKLVGGSAALGSGFAGGVFSPSLFMGAMLGGVVWFVVDTFVPLAVSSQGVYSVVGMAAFASAMLGAPISTLLIVFELTVDYDLVIAVMLASAMASTFMQVMPHGSFFRWQLYKRGINLQTGKEYSLLRTRNIDDLICQNYIRVSPDLSVAEVEEAMCAGNRYIAIINNQKGEFEGSFSTDDVIVCGASAGREVNCEFAKNSANYSIPKSTSLIAALQKLNELESTYAPVVRTIDDMVEVVGVVFKIDVVNAMYDMMRQARSDETGGS